MYSERVSVTLTDTERKGKRRTVIIYKATNTVNGKVYIGKTTRTLEERRKEHEYEATRRDRNFAFYNAIRKYGTDVFEWKIIDKATTEDELNEKERYWIAYYNAVNRDHGYNMTEGGDGVKPNEEVREKLSESIRRRWQDGDYRKKVVEAHKRKTLSEETRRKISEAQKGRKHTEETKRKLSEAHKGKKLSEEHCKKMAEARRGEKSVSAKLTAPQVVFIRMLTPSIKTRQNWKAPFAQGEVAEWFGVSNTQIKSILKGEKWSHLGTFEELRAEWRRLYVQEYGKDALKRLLTDKDAS